MPESHLIQGIRTAHFIDMLEIKTVFELNAYRIINIFSVVQEV